MQKHENKVIIAAVVAGLAGAAAYVALGPGTLAIDAGKLAAGPAAPKPVVNFSKPPAKETAKWLTYTHKGYKISFKYPRGFAVKDEAKKKLLTITYPASFSKGNNLQKAVINIKISDDKAYPCQYGQYDGRRLPDRVRNNGRTYVQEWWDAQTQSVFVNGVGYYTNYAGRCYRVTYVTMVKDPNVTKPPLNVFDRAKTDRYFTNLFSTLTWLK